MLVCRNGSRGCHIFFIPHYALTAELPYRAAIPVSEAFEIMAGDVGTAIDQRCFAALRRPVLHLEAVAA
jgi:HD-GYP domain-containing protein (c-di-GMP phosphodiesterase class II)